MRISDWSSDVCSSDLSGIAPGRRRPELRAHRCRAGCPAIEGGEPMTAALRLIEKDGMDKSKALEAALSQIERAFGKGSVMKLGAHAGAIEIETVSSGSLGLDIGRAEAHTSVLTSQITIST